MAEPRPQRRQTTIVDIARVAGCSKSTVSLVLKGSPLVAAETRARVEEAARKLGYVYNRGAASLRTSKSRFVGMVISDLMNPFFAELAVAIEEAIYARGYVPILANTSEDPDRQAQVLQMMREYGVAGVIMSPARRTPSWSLVDFAKATPLMTIMRRVTGSPLPYVGPDNRAGAREAIRHLVSLGHRHIAFIGGDASMATQLERLDGFRDGLVRAGLPCDATQIYEGAPTRDGGRAAIAAALASGRGYSAYLAYNDIVAIGATAALGERGIVVGREVGVVGFDDIAEAAHNNPPLTTVDGRTRELGARAADLLLAEIDGEAIETTEIIGETRLVVRASCGARATGDGRRKTA